MSRSANIARPCFNHTPLPNSQATPLTHALTTTLSVTDGNSDWESLPRAIAVSARPQTGIRAECSVFVAYRRQTVHFFVHHTGSHGSRFVQWLFSDWRLIAMRPPQSLSVASWWRCAASLSNTQQQRLQRRMRGSGRVSQNHRRADGRDRWWQLR